MGKKIDIHCHTTNRTLEGTSSKNATLGKIIEKMKEHDIEKTVLLATYFPHRGSGISNYRLYDWIKEKEDFFMFGSLDFENYFFQGLNELSELCSLNALKGIKIYTCYQNIDLKSNDFNELIKLSSKYHLPMMFHTGYSYTSMRTSGKPCFSEMVNASSLEFIAKENPSIDFIFSHMAKPYFNDLVEVVNRNPNVYTDMSGLIDSKHEQAELSECVYEIRNFLDMCSSKRLLFGTDFPVQTHEDSIYMIEKAMKKYSDDEKMDVYYNNSWRLLYGK